MNALLKFGVPFLVIGLLMFGLGLSSQKGWLFTSLDESVTGHPIMMLVLYAGLLLVAVGIVLIIMGETQRVDDSARLRGKGKPGLRHRPKGAPVYTPIEPADTEPDSAPPTPKKTVHRDTGSSAS